MNKKLVGTINRYRTDPSGWIGAAIMFAFAIIAIYRWQVSGLLFFILFAFRDVAASWFLLTRNEELNQEKNKWLTILAYVSSGFPFLYFDRVGEIAGYISITASLLAIFGFGIATLALFDLGSSFGVSAANRGQVKSGLYKYLKHPMYSGYIIAELSFVLLNPLNLVIWICSVFLYSKRMAKENRIFESKLQPCSQV